MSKALEEQKRHRAYVRDGRAKKTRIFEQSTPEEEFLAEYESFAEESGHLPDARSATCTLQSHQIQSYMTNQAAVDKETDSMVSGKPRDLQRLGRFTLRGLAATDHGRKPG